MSDLKTRGKYVTFYSYPHVPYEYESITITNQIARFTVSGKLNPFGGDSACRVFCTLETGQIRFRTDGGSPSATEGHLLEIGQWLVLEGEDAVENFRAIRTGGTSGVLKVTYER